MAAAKTLSSKREDCIFVRVDPFAWPIVIRKVFFHSFGRKILSRPSHVTPRVRQPDPGTGDQSEEVLEISA